MDAKDITDKLSIKFQGLAFDDHEDEVVRRGIRCKGNERWIDGTIQAVEFPHGEKFEDGRYSTTVRLKYAANYRRKIFHGYGCEYDTENLNCSGEYELDLFLSIFGRGITDKKLLSSDPSEAHDSTRMCKEGLEAAVINALNNID
ncbi:hypothetical protein QNH25_08570 [Bacillus safensis]|uniref:hypothetical protein n=1 Tax=Bacillus safensis TaxID=561879 RepID=UPI0004D7A2DD|nr:hypothetical protein [Bacillus safensis]KEP29387.1 hypothetical protein ER50_12725 [Bacillus safensis]TFV11331.1 hypothetical protein E4T85_04270 [Bacillus stratosphericus]WHX76984.1 hypothetical protein QNH25_08570 [Bacillus safensis]WHX84441.1 hypothetical protein QNH21_08555 [Bacillus safensis]